MLTNVWADPAVMRFHVASTIKAWSDLLGERTVGILVAATGLDFLDGGFIPVRDAHSMGIWTGGGFGKDMESNLI